MNSSSQTDYLSLQKQLRALLQNEASALVILSNSCSFLYQHIANVNWIGFYLLNIEKKILTLGPFQGNPTCTRIPVGKGVCGTSFENMVIYNVPNVNEFEGHIVCDSASLSEIVFPLNLTFDDKTELSLSGSVTLGNPIPIGVLDIDSTVLNRFKDNDITGLTKLVDEINITLSNSNITELMKIII